MQNFTRFAALARNRNSSRIIAAGRDELFRKKFADVRFKLIGSAKNGNFITLTRPVFHVGYKLRMVAHISRRVHRTEHVQLLRIEKAIGACNCVKRNCRSVECGCLFGVYQRIERRFKCFALGKQRFETLFMLGKSNIHGVISAFTFINNKRSAAHKFGKTAMRRKRQQKIAFSARQARLNGRDKFLSARKIIGLKTGTKLPS